MKCIKCKSNKLTSINDELIICSQCGAYTSVTFDSLSLNLDNSEDTDIDIVLKNLPKNIQELVEYSNETETYWIYFSTSVYPKYVISPVLKNKNINYLYVPYKSIHILERKNYPIPNSDLYLEYTLDYDNLIEFESFFKLNEYINNL